MRASSLVHCSVVGGEGGREHRVDVGERVAHDRARSVARGCRAGRDECRAEVSLAEHGLGERDAVVEVDEPRLRARAVAPQLTYDVGTASLVYRNYSSPRRASHATITAV